MAADDAETQALLTALDVRVLNIALGLDSDGKWRQPSDFGSMRFCELSRRRPDRFAWCTSFDLPRFTDPEYAERVIAELERDVADGAVACKVWKNVGMEVRDPHGNFVLLDHPILRPVFEHLERRRLPVQRVHVPGTGRRNARRLGGGHHRRRPGQHHPARRRQPLLGHLRRRIHRPEAGVR
jgi:predicted TIM-barrel fold metal-dependent hydrolase